ncbi:hypothetical protein ACQ4WP_03405 [Janthinobacterium sp. GB4P2]|uniref:hypothetical protein n=1 Tax=Janthinobacterium sp. GB4P2 TaxID=3424189 RepID=UPI003F247379
MSASNPHFNNIDRAPCELGGLLRVLPAHFSVDHVMSTDERQQAEAAIQHAGNASYVLLAGLESIGKILFSAATNEDWPVKAGTLSDLAALINHIAVEAQAVQETRADLQSNLDQDAKRAAPAGPAKKGVAK